MDGVKNATLTNWTTNRPTEESTDYTFRNTFDIVIEMCTAILCVFGIIGNILSIIVLGRDDVMRKTTRLLLRNVAVADIGVLVISILRITLELTSQLHNLTYFTQYILSNICQMATVYAVVIVTIDRYIAICHPLQSIKLSTMRNARWAIGITSAMAVIFNMPRFYEREFPRNACGDSSAEKFICFMLFRSLWLKTYQIGYETLFIFIVKFCIPLLILIVCNVKLIMAIRASRARHDDRHADQKNTTFMLIAIVILFIVCIIPQFIIHFYVNVPHTLNNAEMVYFVNIFAYLLINVNSSFNFVIYVARGQRFRRILMDMCKCPRARITEI